MENKFLMKNLLTNLNKNITKNSFYIKKFKNFSYVKNTNFMYSQNSKISHAKINKNSLIRNQNKNFSFEQQKDKLQRHFMLFYRYVEDMHYRRSKNIYIFCFINFK